MAAGDFSFLAYVGSWVVITGGVWYLFERAEKTASAQGRKIARDSLKSLKPASAFRNWPATFAAAFDGIFGERHFSLRTFVRSCIASIVCVSSMALFWIAIHRDQFFAFFQEVDLSLTDVVILLSLASINLIPDYFSLLETRYVIRWMSRKRSAWWILNLLIIDLVATALIWIATVLVVFNVMDLYLHLSGQMDSFTELATSIWEAMIKYGLGQSVETRGEYTRGAFFYSTYFTSIWVWLYAVAGFAVKLIHSLDIPIRLLKRFMDIDKKPFQSMGIAAMAIVTLLFLIGLPFAAF